MVRAKPTFIAMAVLSGIGLLAVEGLHRMGGVVDSVLARPGLISRFERRQPALRRPASSAPRCAKDRLALDQVRAEVSRMEKIRTGVPIQGVWEKKDLSKMPVAAAQFLSTHGKWIATEGLDFTDCEGVPCIINRVYGLGADAPLGWNAYGWYLRMGYTLSFNNLIPSSSSEELDHGDLKLPAFLFSEKEVGGFWKLSLTLPDSFQNMGSLQTFHRVPSRIRLPLWTNLTCGDSWGTKNRGYIRLAERCMFLGEESKGFEGLFYLNVLHEMAHRYSSWMGTGRNKDISDRAEWKEFSGWRSQTVFEDGKVKEDKWYSDPSKEGMVRKYASLSPSEDWAESVAHFRYRPETALKVVPRKSQYISEMIFDGRVFDTAGLIRYYVLAMSRAVSPRMLESVKGCLGSPDFHSKPSTGGRSEIVGLGVHVPSPVRECLERGLQLYLDEAVAALRSDEWEACDLLDATGGAQLAELRKQVSVAVVPDTARYLTENSARAPVLQAGIQLRSALQESTDSREAYRHCFDHADPKSCYDAALNDVFARVAQPYAPILGDLIKEERNLYFGQHPFAEARNRVEEFYRRFFAGIEPLVAAAARERWESCLNAAEPDAAAPLIARPYTGGVHFVSAGILACINSHVVADLDHVQNSFSARLGFGPADSPLRNYAHSMFLSTYLNSLRSLQDLAARGEDNERERRKAGVIDVLVGRLQPSAAAFGLSSTVEGAVALCVPAASRAFDEYFGRVAAKDQLPRRFAAIEDVRGSWSVQACTRVVQLPQVQDRVREEASRAWAEAVQVLERAVAVRARDRSTDCVARNPGSPNQRGVRDRRHQCLLLESAWKTLEAQAWVDWEQSNEGQVFVSRRTEAQKYLVERRKVWQAHAAATMDKQL